MPGAAVTVGRGSLGEPPLAPDEPPLDEPPLVEAALAAPAPPEPAGAPPEPAGAPPEPAAPPDAVEGAPPLPPFDPASSEGAAESRPQPDTRTTAIARMDEVLDVLVIMGHPELRCLPVAPR
ncbi:hypothetical protein WMF27_05065 [Sorangium sp. So ce281]|uniref:hypothetical protein n=1 Tax=unclassified Sorangium TaxID=2621164 RepID=UPI003F6440E4